MDGRARAMNMVVMIFYATTVFYVLCYPKRRDRVESTTESSDSDSPSERASKRPHTRSQQRRRANSSRRQNTDDDTRLLEEFKEALMEFNRIASGSETAERARCLQDRSNEVKIVVRAIREFWEMRKSGYEKISENPIAPLPDRSGCASRQASTPRETRSKKRLRMEYEKEEEEKDAVAMLMEGVKEVARILGQCVTAPGEVLDDLEIEIEEMADDVKEVLRVAGYSPKESGVHWLDNFRRPSGGQACSEQLHNAVKS